MAKSEELTEREKMALKEGYYTAPDLGFRAVAIIDAHAADRAALVAQLEAARGLLGAIRSETESVKGTYKHPDQLDEVVYGAFERIAGSVSDVPPTPTHAALVAQLAELTRERNEAREELRLECKAGDIARGIISRQAEANERLALERDESDSLEREALDRAETAEARVRELEAKAERLIVEVNRVDANLEEQRGALDALVEALETLLAASEARAEQWKAGTESYRADATVAQDRLAALRVRVEQAKQLASEALRDSDDAEDALAHVLDHLNG